VEQGSPEIDRLTQNYGRSRSFASRSLKANSEPGTAEHGLPQLSARPRHHAKDEEAAAAFKKILGDRGGDSRKRGSWQADKDLVPYAMKADNLHYEAVQIGDSGATPNANAIDHKH
jgi:hypothetical protein